MGKAVSSRQAHPWAEQLLQYLSTWTGSWVHLQSLSSPCLSTQFNSPASGEEVFDTSRVKGIQKLRCWGGSRQQLQTRYLFSTGEIKKELPSLYLPSWVIQTWARDTIYNPNNPSFYAVPSWFLSSYAAKAPGYTKSPVPGMCHSVTLPSSFVTELLLHPSVQHQISTFLCGLMCSTAGSSLMQLRAGGVTGWGRSTCPWRRHWVWSASTRDVSRGI